jgi:phosphoglycolate phosphatase-like HAD superfamily hydrolase
MQSLSDYDVYIFDCDGVILDSNQLKIDAMREALSTILSDQNKIDKCVDYFRNNFGKSRFHHIEVFVNDILDLDEKMKGHTNQLILDAYSSKCKSLYLSAEITPGFINFIESLSGPKYVASGSEQGELREVFQERGLDTYFKGVFGSPVRKPQLISEILTSEATTKAIMFGDATSDVEAAKINNIDFIAYLPFSNVVSSMKNLATEYDFLVLNEWPLDGSRI